MRDIASADCAVTSGQSCVSDAISASATVTKNATRDRETAVWGRERRVMVRLRGIKGFVGDRSGTMNAISSAMSFRVCQTTALRVLRCSKK